MKWESQEQIKQFYKELGESYGFNMDDKPKAKMSIEELIKSKDGKEEY